MALIDVVAFENTAQDFVWKFPSTRLRWGSQLVVKPGQVAFFVYRGTIREEVREGTITLDTHNLPFLTTLTSVPFGMDSPFQAEVWFVNLVSKLDNLWGTRRPIQLEDPRYGVVVPVRAYGQYGFRITDARRFLESLVGAGTGFSAGQVVEYFTGVVLQAVNVHLARALTTLRISVVEASLHLEEIAAQCSAAIDEEMGQFGVSVVNFYFHSVNVPEDDPSFRRLKELKEKTAELNMLGRDIYQYDRSIDVLKTAAANEGNPAVQAGLGLGVGLGLGRGMASQLDALTPRLPAQPPLLPVATQYFLAVDGNASGPHGLEQVLRLLRERRITVETLVWHEGLPAWKAVREIPPLAEGGMPPIPGGPPPLP